MLAYRSFRRKRNLLHMRIIFIGLVLATLLIYSFAASVDVPAAQGMTEEQILDRYAHVIRREAQWRAQMQIEAAQRGYID